MAKPTERRTATWAVPPAGRLTMREHTNGRWSYEVGVFVEPRGVVILFRDDRHTSAEIVSVGRHVYRGWDGRAGNNTIRRLARQLLTDFADAA